MLIEKLYRTEFLADRSHPCCVHYIMDALATGGMPLKKLLSSARGELKFVQYANASNFILCRHGLKKHFGAFATILNFQGL